MSKQLTHYKQLQLLSGTTALIAIPRCVPPLTEQQKHECIAALNNSPAVYGVVYYIDSSCFSKEGLTNPGDTV